ncbi:MAG TPA: S8 family serine peptidase [Pyrinomonadaceae bacterium]|nr:S8 family serine peptidase [Pyrinomonadaceae bacterium]
MKTYSSKTTQSRPTHSRFRLLAIVASVFVVAVATVFGPLAGIITNSAEASVTSSVIIQFKDDPAAVWQAKQKKAGRQVSAADIAAYRDTLKTKQDQFLAALQARGINYTVSGVDVPNFDGTNAGHVDFRYTLVLNGMSIIVPAATIGTIRSMTSVKKIEPNKEMHILLEKSVDYVRAPQVYGQWQDLTPFPTAPNDGYEGQGMYVAVLDTGEDWLNPMFGGDPTPPRLGLLPPVAAIPSNQKIPYYMTFTGGLPDGFGHGTHSSADIAGYLAMAPGADMLPGTADDVRLHGVAPQAKLMGYKVCADVGSCLNESTIMAIEDAVSPVSLSGQPKPIAHVINMSLGGDGGPDDASSVASDNASLLGTIVVASAGNSGPGESTVGAPASGRHVIAVGANTDPGGGSNSIDVTSGERSGMIANNLDGAAAVTADITSQYVFCGLAEVPTDCPDSVSGKIALIARGSTYNLPELPAVGSLGTGLFSNKAAFAFAKGAIAAVIYNNADGELTAATVRKSTIPVLGISKANGEFLKTFLGANGVSTKSIRINKNKIFTPGMADFSSRGPVQGLGQVKPDVTAPGVDIYSATVRVGAAETNTGTMYDPTGFIHASGTSFSGPHVSGAVTLIKQAHLDWSPDVVRTALINTATNLRSSSGSATGNADIISQGGGLIDVAGAVNTKAIMGVAGDGIIEPSILGSYSFGEAPMLNNRIVNTKNVTVTIQDVSGQGGVYNLSTSNNRYFDRPGITAATNVSSVTVPAGGSATFTASFSLDGNQVRDASPIELQWYVNATNAATGKTIHMPMYFRANPSLPDASGGSSQTDTFTGSVLLGDASAQHDAGVFVGDGFTYNDVPFSVGANTVKVDGHLTFDDATGAGLADLDLYLVNPAGEIIGTSTISGGPEDISVPVNQPGQYVWRVYGWVSANTPYTLTSTQTSGGSAPTLSPIDANWVDPDTGDRYDFDGSFNLNWASNSTPEAYEIETTTDQQNWSVVQQVAGNATGIAFSNLPDGPRAFRVRAIVPGRIGKYVTPPSNPVGIVVSHRIEINASDFIDEVNQSITFPAGKAEIVAALKNHSTSTFYPNMRLEITAVSSTGNTVRVTNADNNGDGVNTIAAFDYSNLIGSSLAPDATSGSKTLKFNNPNNQLFTFTVRIIANALTGTGSASGGSTGGSSTGGSTGGTTTGGTGTQSSGGSLLGSVKVLKFTVNPLTRTVTLIQ